MAVGIFLAQVGVFFMCIRNVFTHQKKELKEGDPDGEPLVKSELVIQIFGYFSTMLILYSLITAGAEPLLMKEVAPGTFNPMFSLILLQCFLMQHMTFHVQVCHITKSKYSPFRLRLVLFNVTVSLIVYAMDSQGWGFSEQGVLNVALCINLLLLTTFLCQMHYILNIVNEISTALNIRVFRVKSKDEQAAISHNLFKQVSLEGIDSSRSNHENHLEGGAVQLVDLDDSAASEGV